METGITTSEEKPFDMNSNYIIISGVVVLLCTAYIAWNCRRIWTGQKPIVFICCYAWSVSWYGTFPLKSRLKYYQSVNDKAGHPPLIRTGSGDDEGRPLTDNGSIDDDPVVQSTMFDQIKIRNYV
jgi:hypothetical protein